MASPLSSRLGYEVSPDGKRTRKLHQETFHGTAKEADSKLRDCIKQAETGHLTENLGKLTVNAYLDRWLETAARPKLAERTLVDYTDNLRRWVRPHIGELLLAKLSPLQVQGLYSKLEQELGARSIRMVHNTLRSAFRQAVRWRLMGYNPIEDVEPPKERRRAQTIRAFSLMEARRFLEACQGHRLETLFRVALASGMRPEEYCGLRWPQVDWLGPFMSTRCW